MMTETVNIYKKLNVIDKINVTFCVVLANEWRNMCSLATQERVRNNSDQKTATLQIATLQVKKIHQRCVLLLVWESHKKITDLMHRQKYRKQHRSILFTSLASVA